MYQLCLLYLLDYLNFIDFTWFEIATPFLIGLGTDILMVIMIFLGFAALDGFKYYKKKKAIEEWLNKTKNED